MASLSEKAQQVYEEMMEPLMIAINYDFQMENGKLLEKEELFRLAMSLHLYALAKGKTLRIDPETKLVIIE